MKNLLLTITFLILAAEAAQAALVTHCTAKHDSDSSGNFDFEIQDNWSISGSYTQLVLPKIGIYQVIYSTPGGYTLVGRRANSSSASKALVELEFDTDFVNGTIRLGDITPPRNQMGKYVEYQVFCKK